jgi:hypothetical protein
MVQAGLFRCKTVCAKRFVVQKGLFYSSEWSPVKASFAARKVLNFENTLYIQCFKYHKNGLRMQWHTQSLLITKLASRTNSLIT